MSLSRVNFLLSLGLCVTLASSPSLHSTEMIGAPGAENHLYDHLLLLGISVGIIEGVLQYYLSPFRHHTLISEVWDELSEGVVFELTMPLTPETPAEKKHRHHHHHHHHHHKSKSPPSSPRADTTHNSLSEDPPPPPLTNSPRDNGKKRPR